MLKWIVHPKMNILINYSTSCCSKPLFIFGCDPASSAKFKAQKGSKNTIKIVHVTSVVQLVLSKDPVLRYQVDTKTLKTSQGFLSTGGTEYPVNPVVDALSERILYKSTETG